MKPLKQELQERGLLYQVSSEEIFEKLDKGGVNFYCGFDPTADSLHLGNFIGFMVAVHIMRRGNTYTALTGGATGMIGDPGGKDAERTFLSEEILESNQKAISNQISTMIKKLEDFTGQNFSYHFVNNKDFYIDMNYLDFLREVGKFITINMMMNKDTVKKRIEDPKQSISYTEFSYMLLQGYDFAKMYRDDTMLLQIGGQDQWGNLVTGTEIIRKKYDGESYALTWPLITDASGKKFGKSEGNAMFLSEEKTTPYFIYQYFMNTADEDLGKYMKMLTLIETEEIDEIVAKHLQEPEKRAGQKLLAFKVVEIIHGTKKAEECKKITEFLFDSPHLNPLPKGEEVVQESSRIKFLKELSSDELQTFTKAIGGFQYNDENLFGTLVKAGLVKSNSEARQSLQSGAISVNGQKISDPKVDPLDFFEGENFFLLQKGKKNLRLILKK